MPDGKIFSWIWKLRCPNKIKLFVWLGQHDRIPTCHYLNNIGIDINPNCKVCGSVEITKQIFLDCTLVKRYWEKLGIEDYIDHISNSGEQDRLKAIKCIRNFSIGQWTRIKPFPSISETYGYRETTISTTTQP